eukprot:TRINITY_DN122079_c0_g1_i1.p1 TRINITY_DN122079_c0_g1~~TRINITY_DN122079_c0_g1_i1.p1  ORF type:complete len:465 (-),score=35.41 TRINITY_DN122079_c0_g1_i1:83-1477(-)
MSQPAGQSKKRRLSADLEYYIAFPKRCTSGILTKGYIASQRGYIPVSPTADAALAACKKHHPGEELDAVAIHSLPEGAEVLAQPSGGRVQLKELAADHFRVLCDDEIRSDFDVLKSARNPLTFRASFALRRLSSRARSGIVAVLRFMLHLGMVSVCKRLLQKDLQSSGDFETLTIVVSSLQTLSPAAARCVKSIHRRQLLRLVADSLSGEAAGERKSLIDASSALGRQISGMVMNTLVGHRRDLKSDQFCPPPRVQILELWQVEPSRFVTEMYKLNLHRLRHKHPEGCKKVHIHEQLRLERSGRQGTCKEALLWHGCCSATVDDILSEGFDPRWASSSSVFGQGVYFAQHFSKSDFYAKADSDGIRRVFLSLVCLGETWHAGAYKGYLTLPPCAECLEDQRSCGCDDGVDASFDSVSALCKAQGGPVDFPEHVVYDKAQALPIAIIAYRHVKDCSCAVCLRAGG